jgi:TrmH family RNA methyltransferase
VTALSINRKKFLRSLSRKKVRKELGLFLVEGDKIVRETLQMGPGSIPYRVESLVATGEWLEENRTLLPGDGGPEIIEAVPGEFRQISLLQEPNRAVAVVRQADFSPDPAGIRDCLSMGLEDVQDPGNMGGIIRTADWFGIRDIFCSAECVELYNPKVIQSTMGSFLRVRVHYLDLREWIGRLRGNVDGTGEGTGDRYPVFATGVRGEDLCRIRLSGRGMILLGNESRGLSDELTRMADRVLSIPFLQEGLRPESLNVAAAAAILCFEFRRQAGTGRSG